MAWSFAKITANEIFNKFPDLVIPVRENMNLEISGSSSETLPKKNTICFVTNLANFNWQQSTQTLVVVRTQDKTKVPANLDGMCVAHSPKLQEAMAKVNRNFFNTMPKNNSTGIHPSAIVGDNCEISPEASVGPYVIVGRNCVIEAGAIIQAHSFISQGVRIGKNSIIESNVHLGPFTQIDENCRIQPNSVIGKEGFGYATDEKGVHHRKPHYGKVILQKNVEIGSNVSIDRGTFEDTIIGSGTKIDNNCHFAHNLIVGSNCFITAGFVVAGSTEIGNNCMFGGGTLMAGHIKVGNNIHVAGGSIVHKNVDKAGAYGGYPLLPLNQSLKNLASFANLAEFRKELSELKTKLESAHSNQATKKSSIKVKNKIEKKLSHKAKSLKKSQVKSKKKVKK